MTTILDGTKLANRINEETKNEINSIEGNPNLVAIQVGENPESDLYLSHKSKKAAETGIIFTHLKFNENISTDELLVKINELNQSPAVDGIMIQLPLPESIDVKLISQAIAPWKDVDGFHPLNKGLLDIELAELIPPTAEGVIELLDEYNIELKGKVVTMIGQGEIAGKPLSKLLIHRGSTVILCNRDTKDIGYFTRQSDVVISAVGFKHLVKAEDINQDSIVINIGLTREENGVFGDVEFETIKEKTSYITPITGGTGPMTVSLLLRNTLKCFKMKK